MSRVNSGLCLVEHLVLTGNFETFESFPRAESVICIVEEYLGCVTVYCK